MLRQGLTYGGHRKLSTIDRKIFSDRLVRSESIQMEALRIAQASFWNFPDIAQT